MWMNLLTSSVPEGFVKATVGEAVLYALIGFMVVFAGIAFLILVVWLVGKLMAKASVLQKKASQKSTEKNVEVAPAPLAAESDEVEEETVAVIMAALTAYYEKNDSKCEFIVKRIKKVRRNDYA